MVEEWGPKWAFQYDSEEAAGVEQFNLMEVEDGHGLNCRHLAPLVAPKMTPEEHGMRHVELHRALDELVADFIDHTGGLPSKTTVLELMEWSHRQTANPETKDETTAP